MDDKSRVVRELITDVLPPSLGALLIRLSSETLGGLEEIRVRAGRPLAVGVGGHERFVTESGELSDSPAEARTVRRDECQEMLSRLTRSSLYAFEEEVRNGYVTLGGGHRCGLVGKAVLDRGEIKSLRGVSGLNLRFAREVRGVATRILPRIIDSGTRRFLSTLIISPPQAGKTTMLRDLARQASLGVPQLGVYGLKVGIVDERSEIAGCLEGVPQRDVGPRTDVLDGCPKPQGTMILLRAMSPDIIVMDELGHPHDVAAVQEATNAGVTVLASAHAASLDEVMRRPSLAALVNGRFFTRLVVLSRRLGPGTVEEVRRLEPGGTTGISSLAEP